VGLGLHLLTGAFWGAIFGLIVSTGRLNGWIGLLAGENRSSSRFAHRSIKTTRD
jgi:hypothetical protein